MLTLITVTMLSMAAAKNDPVSVAGKSFNNCLIEAHNTAMKDKIPVADYKAGTAERCADKRKAFWDVVVKDQRKYGSSQKDAEEYANDEVKIVTENNDGAYETNFENKATLAPEP